MGGEEKKETIYPSWALFFFVLLYPFLSSCFFFLALLPSHAYPPPHSTSPLLFFSKDFLQPMLGFMTSFIVDMHIRPLHIR